MKIRILRLAIISCICYVFAGCQPKKKADPKNKVDTAKSRTTWSVYRGSSKSTNYSGLKQINKKNVDQLQPAWIFKPNDVTPAPGRRFFGRTESSPIIIDSLLYTASTQNIIYAINAQNGRKIWSFDPHGTGDMNRIRGTASAQRGVTYWTDGNEKYILFTASHYLFEIDALTGKPISEFGNDGKVDLKDGLRDDPSKITLPVRTTSPGIIYKDLIILGNRGTDTYGDQPGDIRAYNVRTGKLVWTFHVVPRPGEEGYDTWPKNAWKYVGGAGDWAGLALDKKRGVVFATTGGTSYDFYGGGRAPGKNLFGSSVLALNASTGKLIWYYQTVHHNLWDYDLAAPPNLLTVVRNGKEVDAVAAENKNGFLYLLNRETGKPLFPVEEREVPASDVPGEQAYPTQPFPLKPKPFSNQRLTDSLIADYDPQTHDSLLKVFHSLRYEGLFTPPSLRGTLEIPATTGGVEWGSVGYDPETHIIYIKSNNNAAEIVKLKKISEAGRSGNAIITKTLYQRGELFYKESCAGCHGADLKGAGNNPSLIDLKQRMSKKQVLHQINVGGGVMPSFSQILSDVQKRAILAYLFGNKKAKYTPTKGSKGETETIRKELIKKGRDPDIPMYRNSTAYRRFSDKKGRPAIKPPYGLLSAINLNTGEYEWQITVGRGRGPIVTAGGLLLMATSGTGDGSGNRRDHKLQAYDKATGKLIWETTLPAGASSTFSTYMVNGRQYVVFPVAGTKENPGGSVMAFALPE
jgi:quinoprotein glucose dehydrogenase